jgi:GNAT superfamily N-acetyltransferase
MEPDDEPLLSSIFRSLSDDSRWLRFFCIPKDSGLAAEAHREAQVDHCRTFGLIALAGPDERMVGHAFCAATSEDNADVAFTIANDYRGRGLASILLGQLAEVALANGIEILKLTCCLPTMQCWESSGIQGFLSAFRTTLANFM